MTVTVGIPTKNNVTEALQTLNQLKTQSRLPNTVIIGEEEQYIAKILSKITNKNYYPFTVTVIHANGGIGAAREHIRNQAPDGYLFCLDTEIDIPTDWIKNHLKLHNEYDGHTVVNGPWTYDYEYTTIIEDPKKDEYYIDATTSMHTQTAEVIGGWDPGFPRGCDWDFRIRLHNHREVTSIASTTVSCTPHPSNSTPRTHYKKMRNRPSSIPYIQKYGHMYLLFHPIHILGDTLGILSLLFLLTSLITPILSLIGASGLMAAYAINHNPPGWTPTQRLLVAPAIFLIGTSTIQALLKI